MRQSCAYCFQANSRQRLAQAAAPVSQDMSADSSLCQIAQCRIAAQLPGAPLDRFQYLFFIHIVPSNGKATRSGWLDFWIGDGQKTKNHPKAGWSLLEALTAGYGKRALFSGTWRQQIACSRGSLRIGNSLPNY